MEVNEQNLIRYLLGELPEGEKSALEAQYFADSQVFDQIVAVENKLVDDYARNRLSADLRTRFERSYLTDPARSERVKFAVALVTKFDKLPPAPRPEQVSWLRNALAALRGLTPAVRYSVAFATLLVVLFGAWLLVSALRRQREAAQIQANANQQRRERAEQAEQERKRAEELTANQNRQKETPPPVPVPSPTPVAPPEPSFVTLALTIGGVRGGGGGGGGATPTLALTPATTQVRLVLNLADNDYPAYRATLRSGTGAAIFTRSNVKPKRSGAGASFVFIVPAADLVVGDYVLTISGEDPNGEIDDLGKSLFRVRRK